MNDEHGFQTMNTLSHLGMFEHSYPGILVAIEGLDGTGKSTLIEVASELLSSQGVRPILSKHPTPSIRETEIFNRYQFSPEDRDKIDYRALLAVLLGDRFQHVHEVIRPALARGELVIMDRYIHTMIVMMRARGYDEKWIVDSCAAFPRPDVAWLLDVPYSEAESRIKRRTDKRDSYVERGLFQRIQQHFRLLSGVGGLTRKDSLLRSPAALAAELLDELEAVRRSRLTVAI